MIRWWHGAIAVGGLSALMLLDHPVQRYARENSGTGADNVAGVVRHLGQPEVYGTLTLGLVGVGLLARRPEIARVGGRLGASVLLAGATVEVGKVFLGRPRPEQSLDEGDGAEGQGNREVVLQSSLTRAPRPIDEVRDHQAGSGCTPPP